jgi:hypothetical protein
MMDINDPVVIVLVLISLVVIAVLSRKRWPRSNSGAGAVETIARIVARIRLQLAARKIERDYGNVFMMMTPERREEYLAWCMERWKCGRLEALRRVVDELQNEEEWRADEPKPRPIKPDNVRLGVSVPGAVRAGEMFVARFAAYTEVYRHEIMRVIEQEAPSALPRLGLAHCQWHRNAKVTVRLEADGANVSRPTQTFSWNGFWEILRFDVKVVEDIKASPLILRFDVAVEGCQSRHFGLRSKCSSMERNIQIGHVVRYMSRNQRPGPHSLPTRDMIAEKCSVAFAP